MDASLIKLTTPLALAPDQQLRIERLALETQLLRAAFCTWVWARTLGGNPDLTRHVHWAREVGIPSLRPPAGQGTVPIISAAEAVTYLNRTLAETHMSLPAATVKALGARLLKELRPLIGRRVYAGQLPQPDPTPRVPLDHDVIAIDPYHIHVAGWPDVVIADLWRAPLMLGGALTDSGAASLHRLSEEARRLQARDRDGDPTALTALRALTRRHAAVWGRAGDADAMTRARPHRSGHAVLHRRTAPDGSPQWAVTWSVRIPPGWLPLADRADVVGVDPGVRAPLTWVDGAGSGRLWAHRLPVGSKPDELMTSSAVETLADAVTRHARYARLAEELDGTLRTLLSYQVVAVEDTRWSQLADDGVSWPRTAMTATGVTDVLGWLKVLAPLTGTRVVRMPAWHGSHRCGKCGHAGTVKSDNRIFTCLACAYSGDSDENSARFYRRLALTSMPHMAPTSLTESRVRP